MFSAHILRSGHPGFGSKIPGPGSERSGMRYFIFLVCIVCLLINTAVFAQDEKSITTYIPVSCTGKNTTETFIYDLEYAPSPYQTVVTDKLELKDGQKGQFEVSYTYPGDYHYKVSQREGSDASTKYDKTIYDVDVYVTEDDDGVLHTEVIAYKAGKKEKTDSAAYVNEKPSSDDSHDDTDLSNTSSFSNVKTGDETHIMEFVVLAFISLFIILILLYVIRKKFLDEDTAY